MTATTAPHVLVVGGGIGGLCLAQGLRAAGFPVTVHERDPAPDARAEGYRIHIDPVGAAALHACLPDRLWRAFLATAAPAGDFGFLTERLGELLVVEESIMYPGGGSDPAAHHYAVDRAVLRRLLLAGLGDAVHLGSRFDRYRHLPDGRVEAVFADGTAAVGDVLVGADGTGSRVRRQYLPHARVVDAGAGGVGHKLWLTDATRAWLPSRLLSGMNIVGSAGGVALFTAVFDPPPGSRAALEEVTGPQAAVSLLPYVLCGLVAGSSLLPADLTAMSPDALGALSADLTTGWHPLLRRMLAESDPDDRTGLRFHAAVPTPAWTPSRVTLLGDALHTMPATGGRGGNTALRDAAALAGRLAAVAAGEQPLPAAIGAYERGLRAHGDAAVAETLEIRDRMISGGAVRTAGARSFLRLCHAVPALRRRAFGAA